MKLVVFFLLTSSLVAAQTAHQGAVAIYPGSADLTGSPDSLAQNLAAPYSSDFDKVSAIFKWIAVNIGYDTKGYYNLNSIYKGLFQWPGSADSATVYKKYNDNIVSKVLRERVAVCDGYSRVFKTLCDRVNIRSEIVTGYVRWYSDSIGIQTKRLHAWNAVQIDDKWYLLDVTWGSGYSNSDVTRFKKEFDEYYFLTPPEQLINDHFPLDSTWQLLASPLTICDFYDQPYIFPALKKLGIKSFKPATGIINASVGGKVLFELEMDVPLKQMVVLTSLAVDSSVFVNPKNGVNGNKVTYEYDLKADTTKDLHVIYKGELLLRYNLRVIK